MDKQSEYLRLLQEKNRLKRMITTKSKEEIEKENLEKKFSTHFSGANSKGSKQTSVPIIAPTMPLKSSNILSVLSANEPRKHWKKDNIVKKDESPNSPNNKNFDHFDEADKNIDMMNIEIQSNPKINSNERKHWKIVKKDESPNNPNNNKNFDHFDESDKNMVMMNAEIQNKSKINNPFETNLVSTEFDENDVNVVKKMSALNVMQKKLLYDMLQEEFNVQQEQPKVGLLINEKTQYDGKLYF
jgi:hypothetical protein